MHLSSCFWSRYGENLHFLGISQRRDRPKLVSSSQNPLLCDLTPGYAVDDDSFVAHLPAGRCYAHNLLSIVGSAQGVAGNHLVSFCYLVLNEAPAVGKGGSNLGDPPLQAFASGLLAGNEAVADEVGSHHLFDGVEVRLGACLHKMADQSLVLFFLRRHRSFLLTRPISVPLLGRQHRL